MPITYEGHDVLYFDGGGTQISASFTTTKANAKLIVYVGAETTGGYSATATIDGNNITEIFSEVSEVSSSSGEATGKAWYYDSSLPAGTYEFATSKLTDNFQKKIWILAIYGAEPGSPESYYYDSANNNTILGLTGSLSNVSKGSLISAFWFNTQTGGGGATAINWTGSGTGADMKLLRTVDTTPDASHNSAAGALIQNTILTQSWTTGEVQGQGTGHRVLMVTSVKRKTQPGKLSTIDGGGSTFVTVDQSTAGSKITFR